MQEPPELNPDLWFEMHPDVACPGRHYLLGNAHTVPGRMVAWCPNEQRSHFVSKAELYTCSPEAAYWVAGFLSGNEPPPPLDADGMPAFEGPEVERWWQAVARFSETGFWDARPRACRRCGTRLLPSEPSEQCPACS